MTVNQLIKQLQKIQEKYGKRVKVCIPTREIAEMHNEDFTHQDLDSVEVMRIKWAKDDCFQRADGRERTALIVELSL